MKRNTIILCAICVILIFCEALLVIINRNLQTQFQYTLSRDLCSQESLKYLQPCYVTEVNGKYIWQYQEEI